MESTIKLFKALPINSRTSMISREYEKLMKKTIPMGFIFTADIVNSYTNYNDLISMVEKVYGMTAKKLNSSFHKSWYKVKNTPMEQLLIEQIAHYMTTYGKENPELYVQKKETQWTINNLTEKVSHLSNFENGRIFDKDYVYIPNKKLFIPDMDIGEIKLVIIKGYTQEELKLKLLKILNSGIALSEDTIRCVVDIALFVKINASNLETIKNKEVKTALYDFLNIIPESPIEFLRLIIYKSTGKTLIIKSELAIAEIRDSATLKSTIIKVFKDFEQTYGLEKLAEIFYRFKPIFLAFRTDKELKVIINKIRRLAEKFHKPMQKDYLNTITSLIKNNIDVDSNKFSSELSKSNIFRKIRLAYALKFRTKDVESIIYRIRNGKGFAKEFEFGQHILAEKTLNIVLNSIIDTIRKKIDGKKIFIPKDISYSLPATEKQFTGNFPSGTCITIPSDMIFGIYWDNVDGNSIDFDLSVISPLGKLGWDGMYRNEDSSILFSGDMTDAKNGATELFYIKKQVTSALIVFANYYNFRDGIEVPFKIIVAQEKATEFSKNYMVNPNNILAVATSNIKQKQKILGIAVVTEKECKFYFSETYIGKSITSENSPFGEHSRKYLYNFYENSISLNDVLLKAGAEIVNDKNNCDIDLSPENLEKDTILNLISD